MPPSLCRGPVLCSPHWRGSGCGFLTDFCPCQAVTHFLLLFSEVQEMGGSPELPQPLRDGGDSSRALPSLCRHSGCLLSLLRSPRLPPSILQALGSLGDPLGRPEGRRRLLGFVTTWKCHAGSPGEASLFHFMSEKSREDGVFPGSPPSTQEPGLLRGADGVGPAAGRTREDSHRSAL